MDNKYDALKLENQLCFPLYACSKEVVRRYKPYLDPLGLTYTQYIIMLVLWEKKAMMLKELGNALYLDSGTLTPVLKKMEANDLILRERMRNDERNLMVTVTEKGQRLREEAVRVPQAMAGCVKLSQDEAVTLHRLLYKLLGALE